jgi:vitamin B12/bleomycin/antimicrobial peptide transport system ATP-binding/permease protein
MTTEPTASLDAPADVPGFHLDARVAKAFGRFAGGFWTGATARRAWLLTAGLATSLILSTYITVQMNHWNRWFFDALEKKDVATVSQAVLVFFLIVAAMAAIGVGIVLTRETLQVRWRQWLVERLLDTWLGQQRFYHLNASGTEPPNPEYRISDDTRWATEILVDLGIGLLSAVTGGIAFIAILWTVGGSYSIGGFTIPGYMVWLALAYGITASLLMAWVGRPLVGRVGAKNEAEGYFRFAMMRLRDNAESIALMGGGPNERAILSRFYDGVVGRWLRIVRSHGHVTWITNMSGPMIPIIPLLFAAPKYLAGDLSLGQVTQLAAAFVQVQIAISWVVDNYNRIAEWYASARRVMDIVDASAAIDPAIASAAGAIAPYRGTDDVSLTEIVVRDGQGQTLLEVPALTVKRGELVHIAGDSGTGKSTLVRLIAGLATPAEGRVGRPHNARVATVPAKAYIPLGTLEDVLAYPFATALIDLEKARQALDVVGLPSLAPRLLEQARWDQVLSAGERQRLVVARLMLQMPDIIVLDDALSALEETAQVSLIKALRRTLPDANLLFLGQRAAPSSVGARQLYLKRGVSGACSLVSAKQDPALV